jgi:hypothetical protein
VEQFGETYSNISSPGRMNDGNKLLFSLDSKIKIMIEKTKLENSKVWFVGL